MNLGKLRDELIQEQRKNIQLLKNKINGLEIENALLKNSPSRKATKKKRGKRQRKNQHLKLIAVNGVPISNKD